MHANDVFFATATKVTNTRKVIGSLKTATCALRLLVVTAADGGGVFQVNLNRQLSSLI